MSDYDRRRQRLVPDGCVRRNMEQIVPHRIDRDQGGATDPSHE
jgi:hypothetical protein